MSVSPHGRWVNPRAWSGFSDTGNTVLAITGGTAD